MSEIDLIQAVTGWIGLSYTAAQWWLTVTTALILATYFAAKHVPAWLFSIIIALYAITSMSAIFEVSAYGSLAGSYASRLADIRAMSHAPLAEVEPASHPWVINGWVNSAVFILGSFSAVSFSFIHWRGARK
jgi:phosphatidylglycerophosphate synthase